MSRVGARWATGVVFVLLVSLMLAGCGDKRAEVSSPWPVADAERTIAEPPLPARWPFTGRDADSDQDVTRRPLSVKIENSRVSRPQYGLNSADVVYETIAEGGITRFNCIFHSKVPGKLGPVRSARLSDQWVVPQYDGLLYFSGRSKSVGSVLAKHDIPVLEHGRIPRAYYRVSDRNAPHNLMLDTKKAVQEAEKKGHRMTADVTPLKFERASDESTPSVSRIDIPFSNYNKVRWEYDEDSGRFERFNDGNVHRDASSGNQVSANNVVVMWAKYTEARQDMVGSVTWDINLGGEGKVSVFKDGKRYDGTWKADRSAPPTFYGEDGEPIKLTVGRTWLQVIPTSVKIKVK